MTGTSIAIHADEMRVSDAIIIYLSIGAPFAVHYFLKSGRNRTGNDVLQVILAFLFWPAYAIWVPLRVKLTKDDHILDSLESIPLDAKLDKKVDEIASALGVFFHDSRPDISLREFREILDRYIGLTLAVRRDNADRPGPFAKVVSGNAETRN